MSGAMGKPAPRRGGAHLQSGPGRHRVVRDGLEVVAVLEEVELGQAVLLRPGGLDTPVLAPVRRLLQFHGDRRERQTGHEAEGEPHSSTKSGVRQIRQVDELCCCGAALFEFASALVKRRKSKA